MSKTRAEIEAEIARLRARLDHVEIDPAFTPTELVRWDPSLLGTVLHIKHERNIPRDAFEGLYSKSFGLSGCCIDDAYGSMTPPARDASGGPRRTSDEKMEMVGILIPAGVRYITETYGILDPTPTFAVSNEFESMTRLPIAVFDFREGVDKRPDAHTLRCKALGMTSRVIKITRGSCFNLILPLANPDRPLLDQIFVATSTRVHDTDIIVDKYPLSTLYNEWKRDKEAARGRLPPPRRTELDVAKAQIAELQAQMRLLMADREADQARAAELSKQNGRLRDALHVAVHTPNLGVVPATAVAAASTNATALTNATAAADPV